uniref:Reverse transcriptase RNase H-like domain-containing protein n=1 Tax=Ditylenchus dipsaci TaxID=166011 RepID=A0A915D866_9BILA
MLKKDAASLNGRQEDEAFSTILQRLTTPPVLVAPKYDRGFIKDDDQALHPIIYSSRLLNKAESKYASIEMESLAIVFAMQQYRPYLFACPYPSIVYTDNVAAASLLKRKDLSGRLAKYQLALGEYYIELRHRSGKSNFLADALSRYPPAEEQLLPVVLMIKSPISVQTVAEETGKDPILKRILLAMAKGWPESSWERNEEEELAKELVQGKQKEWLSSKD